MRDVTVGDAGFGRGIAGGFSEQGIAVPLRKMVGGPLPREMPEVEEIAPWLAQAQERPEEALVTNFGATTHTGTSGADFIIVLEYGGASDDTITAGDGDDIVIADSDGNLTFVANGINTFASAASIDFSSLWSTHSNPDSSDDTVPHTTVYVQGTGQVHYFKVLVGNGETITVDIDHGGTTAGGGSTDTEVWLYDSLEVEVAHNDDAAATVGGLGSSTGTDSYLSYINNSGAAQSYYILVSETGGGPIDVGDTYALNISVTGHAATSGAVFDNDSVDGGGGNDLIYGLDGDDTLVGGSGDDTVYGGADDDWINGGTDDDELYGGTGADTIAGDAGDDLLVLQAGDGASGESIDGGLGADTIEARNTGGVAAVFNLSDDTVIGVETIAFSGASDSTVQVLGSQMTGVNSVDATAHTSVASVFEVFVDASMVDLSGVTITGFGEVGDAVITHGTIAADTVMGSSVSETIFGNDGSDVLNGHLGDDHIEGGNGDDTILGGFGLDSVYAGAGNDEFGLSHGHDDIGEIYDGASGVDHINLITDGGVASADLRDDVLISIEGVTLSGTGDGEIELNAIQLSGIVTFDAGGASGATRRFHIHAENETNVDLSAITFANFGAGEAHSMVIWGDADNETLTGGAARDRIEAGDGNDTLIGGLGVDHLNAGAGDDVIRVTVGDISAGETIDGGSGIDTLEVINDGGVGEVDLRLAGISGIEGLAMGGNGALTVHVNASQVLGVSTIAGAGHVGDTTVVTIHLQTAAAVDFSTLGVSDFTDPGDMVEFVGTTETDNVIGTNERDQISGEDGNDTLVGGLGNDTLLGGNGLDRLFGNDGADFLDGDTGNDRLFGGDGDDEVFGGSRHDLLKGEIGNDFLSGEWGDDTLYGGTGSDTLLGGSGQDLVIGGGGNDSLNGQTGNDTLKGKTGNDDVLGGDGDDSIIGDAGNDTLNGQVGNDTLFGGSGDDTLIGGVGNDLLAAGNENDSLVGQEGDDILQGQAGNDTIAGGNGFDTIDGGAGHDVLDGRKDNDQITGGYGNDTMSGGSGADDFIFQNNFGADVITDFGSGDDEDIDLSAVTAIVDFADLMANHLSNAGGYAQITVGVHSILLQGVAFGDVGVGMAYSEDDFIF